ncbi:Ap-3 complex subunit delta-1 [Plakobranchus ocellatus]|uniref:Ap-3 complex subunit delta-1 n=1 Tax=Plakobranchus ocellatus TaxID=259542 RepID=A0AAV3ZS48_9GAST|nr:Ap-3 complex subunit delta-1 [Plakobranchus ocellatus]
MRYLQTEEGSTQDKVDFKINLPCSTYLVATPSTSEEFSALLSGSEACEKSSIKFVPTDTQLAQILAKTCFYLHFRVVEQVENSASLFSRSIQGHPVCLLAKYMEGSLSVDGKSSDQTFLSNILDDMKILLTGPALQQQS